MDPEFEQRITNPPVGAYTPAASPIVPYLPEAVETVSPPKLGFVTKAKGFVLPHPSIFTSSYVV